MSIFANLDNFKVALEMHMTNWYFIDGIYFVNWPTHVGFHINGCATFINRVILFTTSIDIIIASIFDNTCVLSFDVCHIIYDKLDYDISVMGTVYVTKTAKINSNVVAGTIVCLRGVSVDTLNKCHSTRIYIEHATLNDIIKECIDNKKIMRTLGTICISGEGAGIINAALIRSVFPDVRDFSDEAIGWQKIYNAAHIAGLN